MIRIEGIRKSYGSLEVLKGIDLMIDKSDIIAIVGRSGAGKTTLLQLLGTLDRPDAGKIYFNNEDPFLLNDKKLSAFRNRHIGFVFQFHQLLPEFTALENVMIPGMIAGKKTAELKTRATHLLEKLRLADRIQHKPSELSGGEQQRVAIARAQYNQPKVIFADEPTGNLDTANAEIIHQFFTKLRTDFNQTLVIVTHNMALANIADRTLRMKDGLLL